MGVAWSQFYPPSPTLTERNLPNQKGKVFIITGGASGIGLELATILYQAGGKIYIAGRSRVTALQKIEAIKSSVRDASSAGQLEYLPLDLSDLNTVKASVASFKSKESKLDVLWNNAGVSLPPIGSVTKQGHELQIGTNCLGPFLFTKLLLPSLRSAAQGSPQGAVRVVWTSSQMVDMTAPTGGMILTDLDSPPQDKTKNYVMSKTGNWFLASELARDVGPHGILSVTQNPGNLKTNLLRHASTLMRLASSPLLYSAKQGAYTELTMAMNGVYVIPWGRVHPSPRKDLLDALKSEEEGGTGQARKFQEWCGKQTVDYM